jgi:hypothetical protein
MKFDSFYNVVKAVYFLNNYLINNQILESTVVDDNAGSVTTIHPQQEPECFKYFICRAEVYRLLQHG